MRIVEMYHASTPTPAQNEILEEFRKPGSRIRILVSTVAFGMGVSIPDIRLVIHFGAPPNIMCWAQETGRCSRDGKLGLAIVYAYGNSLRGRECETDMQNVYRQKGEKCLRHLMLQEISGGRVLDEPHHKPCIGCDGSTSCSCEACSCCGYCSSKCQCCDAFGKQDKPECWKRKLIAIVQ